MRKLRHEGPCCAAPGLPVYGPGHGTSPLAMIRRFNIVSVGDKMLCGLRYAHRADGTQSPPPFALTSRGGYSLERLNAGPRSDRCGSS